MELSGPKKPKMLRCSVRIAGVIVCAAAIGVVVWICLLSPRDDYAVWSINIYKGPSPFALMPVSDSPVVSAASVTDVRAKFVADPFMLQDTNGRWYMYFEVLSRQGDIGLASSDDCVVWQYEGIVLDEPFHLSYPHVFWCDGICYMIPEACESHELRLYKAVEFPSKWVFQQKLLDGDYIDPSIVRHGDNFYLFARLGTDLTLHWATKVTGPWMLHPASPIVKNDRRIFRQGGRIIELDGRLIRFAQDNRTSYGRQVFALEIIELSPSSFHEREIADEALLTASGVGWNSDGMHHIDAHKVGAAWWACVDGRHDVRRFHLGYGYQRWKKTIKRWIGLHEG